MRPELQIIEERLEKVGGEYRRLKRTGLAVLGRRTSAASLLLIGKDGNLLLSAP